MTKDLADHISTSFRRLAANGVTFRRSDYRLIWALLDVLEEDYGPDRTSGAIDAACSVIPENSDFSAPGAFLHFLAEGIVSKTLIIKDKDEDGGVVANQ